ncbi:thiamine-phosphate kinase [Haladaptatus sp. YSMS36]|uniref:thiamine-phosphate kinase n=1 Tax=Haladaptatus sp. YSMS36 TaxID=3033384 RepID=UPI0023E81B46|nr:thiamine-phosphate kinase [Haladaptatus sp. YSMS36]
MDERAALSRIKATLAAAGDDAAVVDGQVITTDMLHERTDFPEGTTRYTAGWRAVGASLSDVAGMGAQATAAVAVYAAPAFDAAELDDFLSGASDVCEAVGAEYVGGDLDTHTEFTVATTALGETDTPVLRSGAEPGDVVAVTGALGRSAAALRLFEQGDVMRSNDLFQFTPRVAAGVALAPHASAMMDVSDGLARSLHQLAEASDCGFTVEEASIPVTAAVSELAADGADRRELSLFFGEDFELLLTVPEASWEAAVAACPEPLTRIGEVTEKGVEMDGDSLPDRGYTHGGPN